MIDYEIFLSESFANMVETIVFWLLLSIVLVFIAKRLGLYSHPLKHALSKLSSLKRYIKKLDSRINKRRSDSSRLIIYVKNCSVKADFVIRSFNLYLFDKDATDEVLSSIASLKEIPSIIKDIAYAKTVCDDKSIGAGFSRINSIIDQTMSTISKVIEQDERNKFKNL